MKFFYCQLIFILISSSSKTLAASLLSDDVAANSDPIVLHTNHHHHNSSFGENSTLSSPTEEGSVSDTLRILAAGDREIILDDGYRDIVLVLGNTGAGKSTMTQLLAGNNSNLFSYEAEDGHLLIRDTDNKISFGTTLVSKSIYPELVLHGPTATAFYDCPGFSDTRNASVEIANAFFIKKVADHARRLKLLFIVNHSSVKSGQSRTDFKILMEQSTSLIRDTLKFRNGTALFVTKVDSGRSTDSLVQGIARFLTGARRDLAEVFANSNQLQQAQNLIDSFLLQDDDDDAAQKFERIGLFRQPEEIGPLSQIDVVQRSKIKLEKIIFNNTQFVPKNSDDFRVSVSDSAKLLVSNLVTKFNNKLSLLMSQLCLNFEHEFKTKMAVVHIQSSSKIDLIPELESDIKFLQNLTTSLMMSTDQNSKSNNFFDTILNSFHSNKKNGAKSIKSVLENIAMDTQKLYFLHQLNGDSNPIPIPHTQAHAQWLHPMIMAVENLRKEFEKFQSSINSEVTIATVEIGRVMEQNFEQKIANAQITVHEMRHEFQILYQKISTLLPSLRSCFDLQCFSNHVTTALHCLTMTTQELIKISPKNDAPLILLKFPFKPTDWLQPFEKILRFLETQNFILAQRTNDDIQNNLNSLGTILTHHFTSLETQIDVPTNRLSRFSTDFHTLSQMMGRLKQSTFLKEFILEIETTCSKLGMAIPPDFKILSDFYKNEEQIDLFQPVSSKAASPFKPYEWTRPLESVVEFLHKKMADLTRAIEEEKRLAAEKAMEEQIRIMNEEAERLRVAQEVAAKKQEEERLERLKLERERQERERLEEIRRTEQKAEDDRLAREREAKIFAEQQARERALREQMAQIQRELENARRPKKRKWWRG